MAVNPAGVRRRHGNSPFGSGTPCRIWNSPHSAPAKTELPKPAKLLILQLEMSAAEPLLGLGVRVTLWLWQRWVCARETKE